MLGNKGLIVTLEAANDATRFTEQNQERARSAQAATYTANQNYGGKNKMKKIIILLSIICLVALSGCNNYDYYTYADLVDCNEGQYKIDDAEKERLTLKYERNKFMGGNRFLQGEKYFL